MAHTELVGLFDRDVFLKLICCDLWHDTLTAVGISRPLRLASTTSMKSSIKLIDRWVDDTAARQNIYAQLTKIIRDVPVIDENLSRAVEASLLYLKLVNTSDIDGGEALLIGAMYILADPNVMLTGDKRFIIALTNAFPEVIEKIGARLLSFERCLLLMSNIRGASYVIDRTRRAMKCDQVLSIVLASGDEVDEASFVEGLRSYDPGRNLS